MKQWIPIPVEVVEAMDNDRRVSDTPASTLDGFAYAWLKSHRGAPLSQRQLASWARWSKRKASAVLNAVQEAENQWVDQKRTKTAPAVTTENGPAEFSNGGNLQPQADHERTRNGPDPDQNRTDRARSLYRNTTDPEVQDLIHVGTSPDKYINSSGDLDDPQFVLAEDQSGGQPPPVCKQGPQPPKGGTPEEEEEEPGRGKNIGTKETVPLWEALNEKRREIRLGARSLALTPGINRALREALRYATHEQVLHAYDWFNHATEARWWQDNECDLHVFARQKHLENFINSSLDWSFEKEKQREEIDDLPF